MPDQFGNPLPGENPLAGLSPADAAQAQALGLINPPAAPAVGTQMSPADLQREQALVAERPDTNVDPYGLLPAQGAPPQAAPAPGAHPAQPTQFVSAPQAKQQSLQELLQPVGSIGTGSSTTVSKTDLGKAGQEAAKARDEANQSSLSAIGQQEAIAQERANMRAASLVERGQVASAADAQIQQYTAQLQKDTAEGVAGIKRASDDYERAAAELSPNHFWQQQSTGAKIGNLLSIALSGMGQVFSAKAGIQARNGAMDLINSAIDRDIDMQKTALQAKERGIRTKESLYSTLRQKGADDLTAMAATRAAALGKVDRELEAKIATTDSADAKAQGDALRAKVQAAQAAELQRVAEATATRVQSTAGSRPVSGLEVAQMQAGAQAAQQDAERERLGLVKKDPKMEVAGFGQATDPESKRALVEAKLAFDPAENALKVMETLSKKSVLGPADERLFRAARSKLITFANGKYGAQLGALAGPDKDLLDEQIGDRDAMSLLSGGDQSVLKMFRKNFDLSRDALKGYTVRTQ